MANILTKRLHYRYVNAVLYLVIANGVLFLLQQVIPGLTQFLSLIPVAVTTRLWVWQPVTYMFMHGSFTHLLFNMLGLYFFGTQVERTLGSDEFLLFYFLCGIGAGAASLAVFVMTGQLVVVLLGASGAVYAVLLAFAAYYPDARIFLFGIFPVRAPVLVIAFTVIAVFSQITGGGAGVAHFTHLAGFIFAYIYMRVRLKIDPIRVFMNSHR